MSEWRSSSENLIEGTYKFIAESQKLRKVLARACVQTDKLLNEAQVSVEMAMKRAMHRADAARHEVSNMLSEVKKEAMTTEQEVAKLEKLISLRVVIQIT